MLKQILKWTARLIGKEKPHNYLILRKRPLPGTVSTPITSVFSEQVVSLSSKPTRLFWPYVLHILTVVQSVFYFLPQLPPNFETDADLRLPSYETPANYLTWRFSFFFIKLCNLPCCENSSPFCIKNNPDIQVFNGRAEAENRNLESVAVNWQSFLIWLAMKICKRM